MSVVANIEPLEGRLPALQWRWDAETDILSGSFRASRRAQGDTGAVELTDDVGSVAVVELHEGVVCGLDVVVWPEVSTRPALQLPARLVDGRVVVSRRGEPAGVAAYEIDAPLAVETDASESLFHLRIGEPRTVELVRVADHLYVEVDAAGALAGFWLTGVPAFPDFDEA